MAGTRNRLIFEFVGLPPLALNFVALKFLNGKECSSSFAVCRAPLPVRRTNVLPEEAKETQEEKSNKRMGLQQ